MITESFNEACVDFRDFLSREGQPTQLVWICREDVTGRLRRLYVHPSPPSTNRDLYAHYFAFGVEKHRGMRLDVLCFVAGRAYSYVWVPDDDVSADQAMLSDHLRFGFAVEKFDSHQGFRGQQSSTHAAFVLRRAYCRLLGESPPIQELPTRKMLERQKRVFKKSLV